MNQRKQELASEPQQSDTPAEQELVSIITIFLNGLQFFEETKASVFAQTYECWEWILIDDGSTDGSSEFAQSLANSHPERIRYYCHEDKLNRGMSASRNLGIRNAKGTYITLLDVDDIWLPERLAAHLDVFTKKPEIPIVYGPLRFFYNWPGNTCKPHPDFTCMLGDKHDLVVRPPAALLRQIRIADGLPGTCSVSMRKDAVEAVGGFEESFSGMYEDEAFFSKLFMRFSAYLLGKYYDLYRQHENSYSALAIKRGDYVMGPAVPSKSRHRFLVWLRDYASDQRQEEIAALVQQELDEKYSLFV